jgi:MFS family permease
MSRPQGRAALRHRDFRVYQAARFLVTIAIQMQSVAIAWQVYAITHRALDLGYVGLVEFVPIFGLALFAGSVADRFDRVRIMIATTLGVTGCALALLGMTLAHRGGVLGIYGVIVAFGVARAFSAPAGQALTPSLVPKEDFPNAVAWSSSFWQVATIVGPSLGGVLYGAAGAGAVYGSTAALTLIGCVLLAQIHTRSGGEEGEGEGPREKRAATWGTFFAGIRYVRRNRVLLGSISLDLFAVLFGGASALLPVFASDVLHVGPWGLGLLRSAPAVGAAVMGAVVAYRPLRRRAGATMFVCVALFGAATVAFGLSRSFFLSLAALVVIGASDMVSVVVRQTLVQLKTPQEMRGRVSAVNMMFVVASNELGEFESGITAAWLGAVPAVVLGGIGSLLVVLVYAFGFPELRDIDRLEDAAPADSKRAA